MNLGSTGAGVANKNSPASNKNRISVIGWRLVGAAIAGFLLWGAFVPLDKGVIVSGAISIQGNRKTVQHLTGGIVKRIAVSEGQDVNEGELLVEMDSTQAQAAFDALLARYSLLRATGLRLVAERDGNKLGPPTVAGDFLDGAQFTADFSTQLQLFQARKAALGAELAALDKARSGAEAQLAGINASVFMREEQARYLDQQLRGLRQLAAEGYVSPNRLLESEALYAGLGGQVAEVHSTAERLRTEVLELSLRKQQRLQEFNAEVAASLAEAQTEAASTLSRLIALKTELDHAQVRAPVQGTVLDIAIFTNGGVVAPGSPLMDIVPTGAPMMVIGQVPVHVIDRVKPGQEVQARLVTANLAATPTINGRVEVVSADSLVEEESRLPYYKIQVLLDDTDSPTVSKLLKPGLPVQLFVRTGERSLFSYLLKPLMDRAGSALTED